MKDHADTADVRRLLAAATGTSWVVDDSDRSHPTVRVTLATGESRVLRVTRGVEEAGGDDVTFVAGSRSDAEVLLGAIASGEVPDAGVLSGITARIERASPAPWEAFLEHGGGMGGCTFIRVGGFDDAHPDLYLWLDDALAPDADHELVATLRTELPRMLSAVSSMGRATEGRPVMPAQPQERGIAQPPAGAQVPSRDPD